MISQKANNPEKLEYRTAQPSDSNLASRLIFDTFPKMATYIIGLGDARRAKSILSEIFTIEGHRFSYELTTLVYQSNRVVAMYIAYPGQELTKLSWHLAGMILKHYRFTEKIKLILRSIPLIFIQEAAHDEYLLSNLAVKKGQRSQGIGAKVLKKVEEKAQQAGFGKLAMMVEIDNQDARRFYERQGYSIKALHLESNQRVKHLGPGYQRMVKVLDIDDK